MSIACGVALLLVSIFEHAPNLLLYQIPCCSNQLPPGATLNFRFRPQSGRKNALRLSTILLPTIQYVISFHLRLNYFRPGNGGLRAKAQLSQARCFSFSFSFLPYSLAKVLIQVRVLKIRCKNLRPSQKWGDKYDLFFLNLWAIPWTQFRFGVFLPLK